MEVSCMSLNTIFDEWWTGGQQNLDYTFYYRARNLNERFQLANFYRTVDHVVVYNLAANTNYDFVGISLISSDLEVLANGTIANDTTNVTVEVDLTALLKPNDYFDFGVRTVSPRHSSCAHFCVVIQSVLTSCVRFPYS